MAEVSSSDGAEQRVSSEAGAPEVDTQVSETSLTSSQVQDMHEMEIEKPVEEPETNENGTYEHCTHVHVLHMCIN